MKNVALLALILLSGCGEDSSPDGNAEAPVEEKKAQGLPRTYEEAVAQIVAELDEESIEELKRVKRSDLIMYHHGWGTGIRNSFGLWNLDPADRRIRRRSIPLARSDVIPSPVKVITGPDPSPA